MKMSNSGSAANPPFPVFISISKLNFGFFLFGFWRSKKVPNVLKRTRTSNSSNVGLILLPVFVFVFVAVAVLLPPEID